MVILRRPQLNVPCGPNMLSTNRGNIACKSRSDPLWNSIAKSAQRCCIGFDNANEI